MIKTAFRVAYFLLFLFTPLLSFAKYLWLYFPLINISYRYFSVTIQDMHPLCISFLVTGVQAAPTA